MENILILSSFHELLLLYSTNLLTFLITGGCYCSLLKITNWQDLAQSAYKSLYREPICLIAMSKIKWHIIIIKLGLVLCIWHCNFRMYSTLPCANDYTYFPIVDIDNQFNYQDLWAETLWKEKNMIHDLQTI